MKYKLLFLLLMCACFCHAQNAYIYKNLAITATCDNGIVNIDPNKDVFTFRDSIVGISIQMNERSVCDVSINNNYHSPIIVKWKRIGASNSDRDFYSYVSSQFVDVDKRNDEDKLYKGETRLYLLNNWTDDMFSKKKKNQTGHVNVVIVVNDELKEYHFTLTANPIK